MKKIIATFLAALLCLSLAAPAAIAVSYGPWDGRTAVSSNLWTGMALGLNNFRRSRDYYPGVFSDVPAGDAQADYISYAVSCGLVRKRRGNPL